jgi:DUF3050 family protein
VRHFASETLGCAIHSIVEVTAFFFFGREDVIPEMFERLLRLWRNAKEEVPHFACYLERHIELDGGSHSPWAQEMLTMLARQDDRSWEASIVGSGAGYHQPHQTLEQRSNPPQERVAVQHQIGLCHQSKPKVIGSFQLDLRVAKPAAGHRNDEGTLETGL